MESIRQDGRHQPLAADFTVPWAALLQRTGKLRSTGLTGLISSRQDRAAQLYLMEPYNPEKSPLILVHGLLSTPLGWASLTNELWDDPAIRRRYQIWHYH